MDLTTPHEFETYMRGIGSPLSNVDTGWISSRITAWSAILAKHCGRLDWGTNGVTVTEYFNGDGCRDLQLHQIPNVVVSAVYEDAGWEYTSATDSDGYTVDADWGVLSTASRAWTAGPRAVKVEYLGGYTSTSDVPDDLHEAALMQLAYAFRHLRTRGTVESSSPTMGAVIEPVKAILSRYKIVSV